MKMNSGRLVKRINWVYLGHLYIKVPNIYILGTMRRESYSNMNFALELIQAAVMEIN